MYFNEANEGGVGQDETVKVHVVLTVGAVAVLTVDRQWHQPGRAPGTINTRGSCHEGWIAAHLPVAAVWWRGAITTRARRQARGAREEGSEIHNESAIWRQRHRGLVRKHWSHFIAYRESRR